MNIFYTEVDKNLQYELNARGKTGFQNRSTKALDFMLGKIANVEVIAYQGNNSSTPPVARLGGHEVHTSRWLPSGPDGYLTNWTGSQQKINFYNESDAANDPSAIVGNAYLKDTPISDQSRRTGPFITSVDVTIGDHSMGLLNKATINMVVPNVARDLDDVEEAWFRPGRYASIEIVHPESAVVTRDDTINIFGNDLKITGGLLSKKSLPKKERIKELYPDWNVDDFLNKIAQMNVFRFEGLITSFDFSYTSDGSVEATLSLTGTSNVYTDVSMYLTGNEGNQKESSPGTNTENFKIQPTIQTTPPLPGVSTPTPIAFYSFINDRIEAIKSNFKQKFSPATSFNSFLLPFTINDTYTTDTDRFFLEGNQILPKVLPEQIPDAKNEYKYTGAIKNRILNVAKLDKTERSNALATPASGSTPAIPRDPASIPTPASINLPTLTADSSIDDFQVVVGILQSRNLITSDEADTFFGDIGRALNELADEEERVARAANEKSAFLRNFNTTENIQNYNRYITLGALIHVVNTYIATRATALNSVAKALNPKTNVTQTAEIIHSDETNFSNYYPRLVSTDPDTMLFLPKDPAALNDMNSYGTDPATGLVYYKNVVKQINDTGASADVLQKAGWKPWPGVYEKQNDIGKIFPSRIFINVEKIKQIVDSLTNAGKNAFTVKSFIASIAQVVSRCSGNAIDLKLVSYPDDPNKLIFADTRYLKSTTNEPVIPYSVPMFSNHANGSIVREFEFSAKLPEDAKNLSYVLNQGDDITEDQIAPYINFMYNAKNPELINKALETYRTKHSEIIQQLESARISYGLSPGLRERKQALYKAITSYIKYPTSDIRTSQQITAPIFPFEVNFTIDGINGLRYGDVLTFDALPYKYRANTVFSIIGITHTVSTEGDWTTKVNCIMRPSIE